MNLTTIRDAIYDWVYRISNSMEIVWKNQDEIQIDNNFITINISNFIKNEEDYVAQPEDNQESKILGTREFTVEIQIFGNNAIGKALDFQMAINTYNGKKELEDNGIIYVDDLGITNIDGLKDSTWENRAIIEFLFRTNVNSSSAIGQIDSLRITGNAKNYDGTTKTEIINIP